MPDSIIVPDPELVDVAIRLRAWSLDDAEAVRAAVQDPEIPRFMGIPPNHTLEGVQRWLGSVPGDIESGAGINLAIVSAGTGALLGSIGVSRSGDDPEIGEIGYWVCAEARCSGVATRAVQLMMPWAFKAMRLARMEITTHETNAPSARVAEKCGFAREGVLRSYREHQGQRVDLVMWSRLAGE